MKTGTRLAGLAGLLWATAGGLISADPVRIYGSDLLGPEVTTALETWSAAEDRPIQLRLTGTRPALDALRGDFGDIAVLALPREEATPTALPEGWITVPLGYLTAVVVVNDRVPVTQLDFTQLRVIFGAASSVATPRWGDFGGRGEARAFAVPTHRVRDGLDLSARLFAHQVLAAGEYRPIMTVHDSVAGLLRAVAGQDGAIGIVPRLPEEATGVRALLIAPEASAVAFGPTAENLHVGDYPIRMPVVLALPRARASELQPWLRVWFSDEITAALRTGGIETLPRGVRNQQVFDLEILQ